MNKVVFVCFLILGTLWGCSSASRQLSPVELFLIHPGERLTIEQQGERLKWGRLLRLSVNGDTLRVPEVSRVPSLYKEYAEAFATLLNRYLRQMDEADRQFVLTHVSGNIVENAVLGSCIRVKDGRYTLELSKEEALKIGIPEKRYDEVVADEVRTNRSLEENADATFPGAGNISPVSVFFNHGVLAMVKNPGMQAAFLKDLEQLHVEF